MEKGIEKGRQEGIEKGRQEGIEKGKKDEQIAIAREMKKENMSLELISRFTGLSVEEIEKL